jgi:hypothetical protein
MWAGLVVCNGQGESLAALPEIRALAAKIQTLPPRESAGRLRLA